VELADFIVRQRPPPARLLEVGCGEGTLARALADAGYAVTAIDPAAPPGDFFRRLKLEDLEEHEVYDVVVAARSLHHITNLEAALDKIVRLSDRGGVFVLDEFGWDRLDQATAVWFYGRQRVLAAAGRALEAPASIEEMLRDWDEEHVGLHGYDAMRRSLDARFEQVLFEWRPYLYRLLDGVASEPLERSLVDAGVIRALGFRYVGTPRD
jgi:ubiquinone/menaquinone biosynthesis C-methylase UbiE